jgi:tRNA threonylcarbamoyladenosine modification (KEOPS) complex  Pcc1 subunit
MDYRAEIKVKGDSDRIMKVMEAEDKSFSRSQFAVKRSVDGVVFEINSRDPTALRATLNTITQFLVIYHNLDEMRSKISKGKD